MSVEQDEGSFGTCKIPVVCTYQEKIVCRRLDAETKITMTEHKQSNNNQHTDAQHILAVFGQQNVGPRRDL